MNNLERDILATEKDLKKMPFATPEGYFEKFEVNVAKRDKPELFRKLTPYIAMAAMFASIAIIGTAVMKTVTRQDDFSEYGSLAWIDLIPVTEPDAVYYYSFNYGPDEISAEDETEYIYGDTDAETNENH